MQVSPFRSKDLFTVEPAVSAPVKTPTGLWQLSQWRENSIPLVRIRMFTLVR